MNSPTATPAYTPEFERQMIGSVDGWFRFFTLEALKAGRITEDEARERLAALGLLDAGDNL
jgi:hypothetical protein